MSQPIPAREIQDVFSQSEGWDLGAWSVPALVVTRASLKHMLSVVEREMGERGLIPPTRGPR